MGSSTTSIEAALDLVFILSTAGGWGIVPIVVVISSDDLRTASSEVVDTLTYGWS